MVQGEQTAVFGDTPIPPAGINRYAR